MKKILLAAIFVLCISNVQAVTFMGAGTESCGSYLKEKESMPIVHGANISWIVGFLSGAASASGYDVLNNTDSNAIEAAVTKYCEENPLRNVLEASTNIYLQLKKRTK